MRSGRYDKFTRIEHHKRGDVDPDECFVLVPGRDPAAVVAMRAYAMVTPDALLASDLISWADRIEGVASFSPGDRMIITERIRNWTVILLKEVDAGRMDVATALQRIAGHAAEFMAGIVLEEEK